MKYLFLSPSFDAAHQCMFSSLIFLLNKGGSGDGTNKMIEDEGELDVGRKGGLVSGRERVGMGSTSSP